MSTATETEIIERLDRLESMLVAFGIKPAEMRDEPLDVDQAAAYLKKSKKTLYNKIRKVGIPFHKRLGKLYFFKSDLDTFIKSGKAK